MNDIILEDDHGDDEEERRIKSTNQIHCCECVSVPSSVPERVRRWKFHSIC